MFINFFLGQKLNASVSSREWTAVIVSAGCNLQCPYCTRDLASPKEHTDIWPEILAQLTHSSKCSINTKVVITGGEPLMHNLREFAKRCAAIKKLGYKIRLNTNGLEPKKLRYLIHENLVDTVGLEIKTYPANYHQFSSEEGAHNKVVESIDILFQSGIDFDIVTPCISPFMTPAIIDGIGKLLPRRVPRWILKKVDLSSDRLIDQSILMFEDDIDECRRVAIKYAERVETAEGYTRCPTSYN